MDKVHLNPPNDQFPAFEFSGVSKERYRSRFPEVKEEDNSEEPLWPWYCNVAKESGATDLQSNDAEVNVFQRVADHLRENNLSGKQLTLYLRGSKGSCTSCRRIIRIFMEQFPRVRVICVYRQKDAIEKDQVSKEKGQAQLSYGYPNTFVFADLGFKKLYCKILPAAELQVIEPEEIPGVIGIKTQNLQNFFANNQEQLQNGSLTIQEFVQRLPTSVVEVGQRAGVIRWLEARLAFAKQTLLSEKEREHLTTVAQSSSDADVQYNAKLYASQGTQ